MKERPLLLVTGATGYIGGRLVPRLLDNGYRVRCLVRHPRKLADRPWIDSAHLEVVEGDVSDPTSLDEAMRGCSSAYYLVHSMIAAGADYRARDRLLAQRFAEAAARAKLERLIYLGGLGEKGEDLSEHLSSRREVEHALAAGPVPVTVLRAAMIIGSGSASFEILRYLVERLPIMVTPRWVRTVSQPIGVRDVLHYLVTCLECPKTTGRTLDVGGPDVLSYKELMQITAENLGISKRVILPVPILTPGLSSLWIHFVTPVDRRVARPLAEGLKNPVVCRDDTAAMLMPHKRQSVREAIAAALDRSYSRNYETVWSGAGPMPGDPEWAGGRVFVDTKEVEVKANAEDAFRAICRIGGGHGWYAADGLWKVRGWLDRLVGGPGLRRLRRDPDTVGYGETLDFWRVTGIEPDRRLELRAEMKLPGEALLDFRVEPLESDPTRVRISQTARFKPRGLLGLLYWYSVVPLHGFVFRGMLSGIARAAQETRSKRLNSAPEIEDQPASSEAPKVLV